MLKESEPAITCLNTLLPARLARLTATNIQTHI